MYMVQITRNVVSSHAHGFTWGLISAGKGWGGRGGEGKMWHLYMFCSWVYTPSLSVLCDVRERNRCHALFWALIKPQANPRVRAGATLCEICIVFATILSGIHVQLYHTSNCWNVLETICQPQKFNVHSLTLLVFHQQTSSKEFSAPSFLHLVTLINWGGYSCVISGINKYGRKSLTVL